MANADGVHVNDDEAKGAVDGGVYEPETASSWLPTKKWWAAFSGAVASIVASWIVTGSFDDVERGMVATALVSLVAAYFKSNDGTPAGVPEK